MNEQGILGSTAGQSFCYTQKALGMITKWLWTEAGHSERALNTVWKEAATEYWVHTCLCTGF